MPNMMFSNVDNLDDDDDDDGDDGDDDADDTCKCSNIVAIIRLLAATTASGGGWEVRSFGCGGLKVEGTGNWELSRLPSGLSVLIINLLRFVCCLFREGFHSHLPPTARKRDLSLVSTVFIRHPSLNSPQR